MHIKLYDATTTLLTVVKDPVKKFKRVVTTIMATNYRHMYFKRCNLKFETRSHKKLSHYDVIVMKLRHFIDFVNFVLLTHYYTS